MHNEQNFSRGLNYFRYNFFVFYLKNYSSILSFNSIILEYLEISFVAFFYFDPPLEST